MELAPCYRTSPRALPITIYRSIYMKEFYRFCSMGMLCSFLSLGAVRSSVAQTLTARNTSPASGSNGFYEYLPAGYSTTGPGYPLIVFNGGQSQYGNGGSDLSRMLQG